MAFTTSLARRLQGQLLQQRVEIGHGGFLKDRGTQDGYKTTLTRRVVLVHNIHHPFGRAGFGLWQRSLSFSLAHHLLFWVCGLYLLHLLAAGRGFVGKRIPRLILEWDAVGAPYVLPSHDHAFYDFMVFLCNAATVRSTALVLIRWWRWPVGSVLVLCIWMGIGTG
ncbi:hypothetical protein BU16DRAFT_156118 [Lophium mytilinum]|uniref:Uncharacterized protein n=1 Tax=Lophium mytilinum TaxID=390894 RepID=A0A6A6QEH9_9PEZI|nr:hypothetical protein BU16DRAFT_156118 [Lophium mytilinum]